MTKKTLWISFTSALGGVAIALLAAYIFAQWYGAGGKSVEDVRNDYILDYSKRQQVAFGKSCLELGSTLRDHLERGVSPIISSHKSGESWLQRVPTDVKSQLDSDRDFLFMCQSLYREGHRGKINGLERLAFAEMIDKDFASLIMLLKYGVPQNCDDQCIEDRFKELQERYKRILAEISSTSPS